MSDLEYNSRSPLVRLLAQLRATGSVPSDLEWLGDLTQEEMDTMGRQAELFCQENQPVQTQFTGYPLSGILLARANRPANDEALWSSINRLVPGDPTHDAYGPALAALDIIANRPGTPFTDRAREILWSLPVAMRQKWLLTAMIRSDWAFTSPHWSAALFHRCSTDVDIARTAVRFMPAPLLTQFLLMAGDHWATGDIQALLGELTHRSDIEPAALSTLCAHEHGTVRTLAISLAARTPAEEAPTPPARAR